MNAAAIEVENLDWLVPPAKDVDVHVTSAFAQPWPNPYPDMMGMDMTLDTSFTASLEDSIVDPNLLGGSVAVNDMGAIAAAGTVSGSGSFIKQDNSSENSPEADFLSNSSSSKKMPSLTPDSLPPSLPTPPSAHSASSAQGKKRGRPHRQQQQQQEDQPPKRRRSSTQKMMMALQNQGPDLDEEDEEDDEDANFSMNPSPASSSSPSLSPSKQQQQSSSLPQDKRSRIREKNRIAACKCRRKQRKAVNKLTSRHEELEDLNRQLNGQVSELEAEAYVLKNMLMAHGNCGCEMIQQYFRDAAASLVQKADIGALGEGEAAVEKSGAVTGVKSEDQV